MQQTDLISNYGYDFQCKLIASLLVSNNFLATSYDIIKSDYFESEGFKWTIQIILDYYKQYHSAPNLDVFKVKLSEFTAKDDTLKSEIKSILRDSAKVSDSTDLEFIQNTTIQFCANQALKQAILDSVDYIKAGKTHLIKKCIDDALMVGQSSDLGEDYTSDDAINRRYSENIRNTIPTGWTVVNELMKGGLGAGELGVVVGATGSGKSWLLMHIGASAVKQGFKVLHVTLELDELYTGLRYDSIFTSTASINLTADVVKKKMDSLPGKLKIKWFPTKSLSMAGLKGYINKLRLSEFGNPDLVIIDYLDIMKLPVNSENHLALTAHYEDARGLAGEEKLPIWSASQGSRESYNSDILEADKVAGAFGKIFTADFAMSISRKAQDKASNTARSHIIKNRFGPDGLTLPVSIDTYRGIIEMYNESTKEGKEVQNTMTTSKDYERLKLANKYKSLSGKVDF